MWNIPTVLYWLIPDGREIFTHANIEDLETPGQLFSGIEPEDIVIDLDYGSY